MTNLTLTCSCVCAKQQVLFDAPYNRMLPVPCPPRLMCWEDWRAVVWPLLGQNGGCGPPPPPTATPVSLPNTPLPVSATTASIDVRAAVQRQQDLLLPCQAREPLSPADMANIVCGSSSQLEEGAEDLSGVSHRMDLALQLDGQDPCKKVTGSSAAYKYTARRSTRVRIGKESANPASFKELHIFQSDMVEDEEESKDEQLDNLHQPQQSEERAAKRVLKLRDIQQQRTEAHRIECATEERKASLRSEDPQDVEGLQLFKQSYNLWRSLRRKLASPFWA